MKTILVVLALMFIPTAVKAHNVWICPGIYTQAHFTCEQNIILQQILDILKDLKEDK